MMSFSVIFLVSSIFAVSQAIGDSKNGYIQSDIQMTRSAGLENSVKNMEESLRGAQMKLQANQIEGSAIPDDNQSNQAQIQSQFHSQDLQSTGSPTHRDIIRDQSLFQSQRNVLSTTGMSSVPSENSGMGELSYQQQMNQEMQRNSENQQMYSPNVQPTNQQQFHDDKQSTSDERQVYSSRQQTSSQQQLFPSSHQSPSQQHIFPSRQQPSSSQQQFYNTRHQTVSQQQQIHNPREQTPVQQQQFLYARQQAHDQQKIYSDMKTMAIDDQRINLNHQFQGVSVHQSQIRSERPQVLSQDFLTQMQSKGVSKDVQLSVFDNREHGLTLPRSSTVNSASVIVSGLKNLPMLPALVYNGGPVPSTHAITYGRDGFFKGSASLRQQLQTPYVRYVYSHIL